MNLVEPFIQQVAGAPERPAVIEGAAGRARVVSYGEMAVRSARLSELFRKAGLREGDTALLFLPMSADLYAVLIALFRAGLTAMFVDPAADRETFRRCCETRPPQAFIGTGRAQWLRWCHSPLRRIPRKFTSGLSLLPATSLRRAGEFSPNESVADLPGNHPALITFTSGSTGNPKTAVRTHEFLLAQHRVLSRALELRAGETDLATLPVFALANLASGLTTLLPDADLRRPGFIAAQPVLRQIERFRPDRCTASPAFFERLAESSVRRGTTADSFSRLDTGGAPVFPRTLESLLKFAPKARVHVLYGSTEAEPISDIAHDEITPGEIEDALSGGGLPVGPPAEETEVRIIRDNGGAPLPTLSPDEFIGMLLPAGTPGEIIVSGPHVLAGYLNGVGDRENKLHVDGTVWHRTGDAGLFDERGRLRLLGRCSARVPDPRQSESWLYPFAVECAATRFPQVRRAALIRRQSENWLALEMVPGARPPDRSDFGNLAEAFHHIVTVPRLPVDSRHNAKIVYPELERMLDKLLRR